MSNLAIIQKDNLSNKLNSNELLIVSNALTPKLKDIDVKHLKMRLHESIQIALLNIGQKNMDEMDKEVICQQISEELKKDFPHIKIGEVMTAIKYGSFGKYKSENERLYITSAIVFDWIKKYQETKHEAIKKQLDHQEAEQIKILEMERDNKMREEYYKNLPKYIANAKDGKCKMADKYFDHLWSWGLIKMSENEKNKIKKDAKEQVINRLRTEKKNQFKIGEENINKMVLKRAKEIAFFKWIESNKYNNIVDLISKYIKK